MKRALLLLTMLAGAAAAAAAEPERVGARLGGDTSVLPFGAKSYTLPAANLDPALRRDFFFGNRLFNTRWTIAPGSVQAFDGLGPLFNRSSCSGCHVRDGRGQPPAHAGAPLRSMLVRLSVPGQDEHGGPRPHPVYGGQFQDQGIAGVPAEGQVWIHWEQSGGRHADGSAYTLLRPRLEFRALAYGPLGETLLTSPRVAPAMIGLGLLEAVPEAEILARADPDDTDGDGISGRPNRIWDAPRAQTMLGRFGWKANTASLRAQVGAAAAGDLGLTSVVAPQDDCRAPQAACRRALRGGADELPEDFLRKLVLYVQTLAVPLRRAAEDPAVLRGEALFAQAGCAACHRPTLRTGDHAVAALAQQTIHPYSDLLLHDLGEGLADGRPDGEADGREWRTAPLWGIGLVALVNGHTRFLHDGRARNLEEAILWHGGEAAASREAFMQHAADERVALLRFLESL
jgi:CxxC motif-containing protein (DUF1111 family)